MNADLVAEFEMRYPGGTTVRADLRQPANGYSVTVLFGPSGGGKTTILRCLAGLETPANGSISFGDETWFDAAIGTNRSPQQRRIAYVAQDYALFPHLTLCDNIGFGLRDLARQERSRRVGDMVSRLGLNGLEKRFPAELSGGQQQRVALARALVRRPRLVLLDEPLSALDAATRDELRHDLRRILSDAGVPVVLVTHDRIEAISLADHLVILDAGRTLQQGSVQDVFSRPRDIAVARVVGVETVEAGQVEQIAEGLATVAVGGRHLTALAPETIGADVYVCIRAEDVLLQASPAPSSVRNQLPGTIVSVTAESPMVRITIDCGFQLRALVTRVACAELNLQAGHSVCAILKVPAIHLIPRRR